MGETDKGDRRMNAADRIGMETAVREAEKAAAEGEIPVGAALYRGIPCFGRTTIAGSSGTIRPRTRKCSACGAGEKLKGIGG